MIDLNYDPASLCGPVDLRVARSLEQYRKNKLPPSYLRHLQKWHGGIPGEQYSEAEEEQDLPRWPVSPAQT